MRSRPTNAEMDLLVTATLAGLPDSFRARKAVLVALLVLLPRTYPRRDEVREMLHGLRIHEQAQARFAFAEKGAGR